MLLTERPSKSVHLGGYWEFPGGKLEPGESAATALARELSEEIDIAVVEATAFMSLTHRYPERTVHLSFFAVTAWRGEPRSAEGQRMLWVPVDELNDYRLLPADAPVVAALQRQTNTSNTAQR